VKCGAVYPMHSLFSTFAVSLHSNLTHHQLIPSQYNHALLPDFAIPQMTSLAYYIIPQPFGPILSPLLCHPVSLPFHNTNSFLLHPNPFLCAPFIIIHLLGQESNPPLGSRSPADNQSSQLLRVPFMKFPHCLQPIHKLPRYPYQCIRPSQTYKVLNLSL
jgi:hypothetical protein